MQPGVPDTVYNLALWSGLSQQSKALSTSGARLEFALASPDEPKQQKIPLYSSKYFQACTIGGILACGIESHLSQTLQQLLESVQHIPSTDS